MNKRTSISIGVVERANSRLMRDGIKESCSINAHRACDSISVSVRYRGENFSQTISKKDITKAFEKSVKSVIGATKL
jgi:hypothetical protein